MKKRSFWGWGYEEDALSEDQRENLKMLMGMRLGAIPEPLPAPRLDQIELREPRVSPPGSLGFFTAEKFERASHTYGKAFRDISRALNRDFSNAPDAVAYPSTEAEIVQALDWAADANVAVIPFGGGSSVVGGVEARFSGNYRGAVSLDMRRFDKLVEVDPTSRSACLQGGLYGPDLEEKLKPHGYTLRHYPQSFEFSTLGGWIATRAGGHFATLYTHIDDFVESVRVVTPTGAVETRRLPGSGAGPSPDRMWIGSEGTLGIITQAWMRLQDRPKYRAAATIKFDDFLRAAEAARLLAQSGLYPSNCRLLDAQEALNNGAGDGTTHLLLVAFESADHPLEPWMDRALEICRQAGGSVKEGAGRTQVSAEGEREGEAGTWRDMFLRGPYMRDALAQLGLIVETFETACTWDRFPDFHQAIVSAVADAAERVCGAAVVSCRFTHVYPDGPAPYYTVLAPGKPGSHVSQWDEIKHAASEAINQNGGTITHHHAVGRDHRPWYDRQRPDRFAAALRAVKHELDPAGILNPGVLIDP